MITAQVRRSATTLLEVLLAVALIGVLVLAVARPVLGPAGLGVGRGPVFGAVPSVEARIDPDRVLVETTPPLPSLSDAREVLPGDSLEMTVPTATTVAVYDPDLGQGLRLVGAEVLRGLVAAGVLALLLMMVRTLRQGDPFVPANARRLYLIAALVGLGGQGALLIRAWGEAAVVSHPRVAPYLLQEHELSLVPLVAGLGIAVAAEVFRQGAAMREDLEGLV